jgi:hypothetical protein
MAIVIPHASDIFDIEDVRALRRTCKLTSQLVTSQLKTLTIDLEHFPQADYPLLAVSPLLDNIRDLDIASEEDFDTSAIEQWRSS